MREVVVKVRQIMNWDKLGMALSLLCAIHCILTPLIMLSIPIMARYYLGHPLFHIFLALAIIPVGIVAFVYGYKHHHKTQVFWLGLPGLLIVSIIPVFFHNYLSWWIEPFLMLLGSSLLISAHWMNRRSCSCPEHQA